MRAADLQRCGGLFQIQPIIYDRFRIAGTPPPRTWEGGWAEKTRREVQPTDTIPSLRPLVSAEDQKINAAVNHIDGKNTYPLRGIDNKDYVAFTTQTAQRHAHP